MLDTEYVLGSNRETGGRERDEGREIERKTAIGDRRQESNRRAD